MCHCNYSVEFTTHWNLGCNLTVFNIVKVGRVSCQSIQPQGAVTGLSTSIPCDHGRQEEAPFWFINDTAYELFSIPQYLPSISVISSYTSLTIPNVTRAVDNTVFRCATFDNNGNITSANNAIRLLVAGSYECMSTWQRVPILLLLCIIDGDNPGSVDQDSDNELHFDYQRLNIEEGKVVLAWSFSNICNEDFELQGFVISNDEAIASSAHVIGARSSNTTEIHTSQLSTASGEDVYFRLVAVSEAKICSDATSQVTYFSFEGENLHNWLL